ncbi:ABC transporter ATP-binding protein [Oerskovia turbata]|uniref:ABC transporter ATP-binding protein n=1 Tax=Oerskovia turbata TaxID=1713 RepID=A0A4Q1KXD7_9CELL|nr:ABC transporter ATP-binding protein [Oerskovia turbata]RXR26802.1 ABC transporter ATP-binding protein [Oerskovia turbata]RXR34535.1 ABC transporter ATP-binding protein [Oerskovia turbata]TGJ97810.1 ABC transporter ATP-binding protein [Actinotalea fermentans ATCC 43279 = JCM 9966 = DSM 3133]
MIEARGLTKRYGPKTAVDGISFTVHPGQVTGFLGPNGAGKSTTMRMIMGLDRPTGGSVTVNGQPYAAHRSPLTEVGALLDAKAVHTGRSAYNHLLAMAATHGIPKTRVQEVIEMTGLQSVAKKRVGGFSLGMGQRLGIASALLGDPKTLILDEPVNGLDPEGVLWVRNLARYLASEGRTVFLSSHLMSEVALTADHIIVIGKGRIIADAPVKDIVDGGAQHTVRVRTPQATQLAELLTRDGATVTSDEPSLLQITGAEAAGIGELAAASGIVLHELTPVTSTLEEAYMLLTADSVEYQTESAKQHVGHGVDSPADAPISEGAKR